MQSLVFANRRLSDERRDVFNMTSEQAAVPEDLSNEAEEVVYTILDHNDHESSRLPFNPNFLNFVDNKIDFKYNLKIMGFKQDEEALSPTLRNNLVLFNLVLMVFISTAVTVQVVLNARDRTSTAELTFHLVYLLTLLVSGVFILVGVLRSLRVRYRMKRTYLVYMFALIFYLVIGDHRVFVQIISEDSSVHHMNYTLLIYLFLLLYTQISFSHFLGILVLSVYTLVLYLLVFMLTAGIDRIAIIADSIYILLFCIVLCLRTYQTESRARHLFWRLEKEEQAIDAKQVDVGDSKNSSGNAINTEVERLIELCDNIKRKIKAAATIIMFNEVKTSLKEAQTDIEKIKRKIARGNLNDLVKLEVNQGIDEEDRAFIYQQFVNISSTSRRNSSRHLTIGDRKASIVNFDEYGIEELNSVLMSIGKNWNFDIWFVHKTTGHSVFLVAKYLLRKWEFNSALHIPEAVSDNFFQRMEIGYRNNPYHNACHAADVCHSLLYFTENSDIVKYLTGFDMISIIIASLGHDLGHPALTNRYLVNTRHKIALRYNDSSVLENMHIAKIFKLLSSPESDILQTLVSEDWVHVRKIVIEMILTTDMGKHFEVLGKFRSRVTNFSDISLDNNDDKIFVLSMGIKTADIAHSAKNDDLHKKWTDLVCEEFFNQGDTEKNQGLPVSMYCDRETTDIPKSQAGFLKNICLPLFDAWNGFLNSQEVTKNCLDQVKRNLVMWESKSKTRRMTVVVKDQAVDPSKTTDEKRFTESKKRKTTKKQYDESP